LDADLARQESTLPPVLDCTAVVLVGITAGDGVDGGLVPRALMALTVKVYGTPAVSPVAVQVVVGGVVEHVWVVPVAWARYLVMGLPPSFVGGVHKTVADRTPATAFTPVGASGGPSGVMGDDRAEGKLGPIALTAVTVNLIGFPAVSAPTVQEVAGASTRHV
jgi:hypothetical protein